MTHEETETERLAKALREHRAALDRHREEMAETASHEELDRQESAIRDLRTLLDVTQKRCDLGAERIALLEARIEDRDALIDQLMAASGRGKRATYRDDPSEELLAPPVPRCTCEDRDRLLWCTCGGPK